MYNYIDECIMCGDWVNNQHTICTTCRVQMSKGKRLDTQFPTRNYADFRKESRHIDSDDTHDFFLAPLPKNKEQGDLVVKISRGYEGPIPFDLEKLEKNPNVTVVYIPKGQLHVNIVECFLCGNVLKSHPTVCDGCLETAKEKGADLEKLEKIL